MELIAKLQTRLPGEDKNVLIYLGIFQLNVNIKAMKLPVMNK